MGQPRFKGIGLKSFLDWVEARHGKPAREEALAPLTAEEHGELVVVLPSKWYPVSIADKIWRHYADRHLPRARADREKAFRALGRHIAEDNLDTVYRVMMSSQAPTTVVEVLPTVWHGYFEGTEVEAHQEAAHGAVTIRIRGLGRLAYIAPVTCGWIQSAYEKLGSSRCEVTEQSWSEGALSSNELRFTISWQ